MHPIHPKAMPVIITDLDEQRRWLEVGDESLLRPYKGEMESDQLPDTLENYIRKKIVDPMHIILRRRSGIRE